MTNVDLQRCVGASMLDMSKAHVAEAKVPKKKILLSGSDVLICFISDGKDGGAVAMAGRKSKRM